MADSQGKLQPKKQSEKPKSLVNTSYKLSLETLTLIRKEIRKKLSLPDSPASPRILMRMKWRRNAYNLSNPSGYKGSESLSHSYDADAESGDDAGQVRMIRCQSLDTLHLSKDQPKGLEKHPDKHEIKDIIRPALNKQTHVRVRQIKIVTLKTY
jgi:hypothetical protein